MITPNQVATIYDLHVHKGGPGFALTVTSEDLKRRIYTQALEADEIVTMAKDALSAVLEIPVDELKVVFRIRWSDEAADAVEIPAWVNAGIEKVFEPTKGIATRYPYTYAYDFIRSHHEAFGLPLGGFRSRAETAKWLRDRLGATDENDPVLLVTLKKLADAYLREHNECLPE